MSCPNCGTNIHYVKCSKCGAEICDFCGEEINWNDEENASLQEKDNPTNGIQDV